MTHLEPDQENMKRTLASIMNDPIPDQLDERLEKSIQAFRENLADHPYIRSNAIPNRMGPLSMWVISKFQGWNLAWSTGLVLIALFTIHSLLLSGGNPSWADVTRQFKSIPFIHATVYAKQLTSAHAEQYEIWMGNGGKVRLRYGRQILFADQQGLTKAYDIVKRSESPPHEDALHVINLIHSTEVFSLETVIQTLTGNMDDLRPVPNRIEDVSNDISIFELSRENSADSIRIWTLRESLLPIQLQQKNTQSGDSIDVFFSYLIQQPDAFFDPLRFAKILQDPTKNDTELLEAF